MAVAKIVRMFTALCCASEAQHKSNSRLAGRADLPTTTPLPQPKVLEDWSMAADVCKRGVCPC